MCLNRSCCDFNLRMRELKIDTCVYLRLQWHPALREGSPRGSILSLCSYPCFILDKSRYSLTRRYTRDALRFSFSLFFFLFFFNHHVVSGRVIEAFFARFYRLGYALAMKTGFEGRGDMCLVTESIRSKSLHFGARSLKSSMNMVGF